MWWFARKPGKLRHPLSASHAVSRFPKRSARTPDPARGRAALLASARLLRSARPSPPRRSALRPSVSASSAQHSSQTSRRVTFASVQRGASAWLVPARPPATWGVRRLHCGASGRLPPPNPRHGRGGLPPASESAGSAPPNQQGARWSRSI